MFDSLSERLEGALRKLRGIARISEDNIAEAMREVRMALLEADVNLKVVREFVDQVKLKAVGLDVLKNVTPGQQLVGVVNEELVKILGSETAALNLSGSPAVIMMVGLQGSGKTTTAGKLALKLKNEGRKPYLTPADVYRPAAIEQLTVLAGQLDIPVYPSTVGQNPVDISAAAVEMARSKGYDTVILDTAGRLHIDETLMAELESIKARVAPKEILFVADAMSGQDAVTVAESFNNRLDITGVVLTKMDGDARGGAALSIKSVTGKPIKLVGVGEKLTDLEVFHPDRIASRILGMGDVLTLLEKAQAEVDEKEALDMQRKLAKAEFNLEDFRTQMRRMRKMGSLEGLLKLIPGMSQIRRKIGDMTVPENEMARVEAMINSMTAAERKNPKIINASRKDRIAKGSGTKISDINELLRNFENMRQLMKNMLGKGGMTTAHGQPVLPGLKGSSKQKVQLSQKEKKKLRKKGRR